ncbi:MAG: HAD family hydrolase [Fidelibacterota bacterium]
MNKSTIKIVFTDLDGTLLNSNQVISRADLEMLHQLKDKNIVRVIATGRNLYSLNRALASDFPVDYVIFSSGAGIMDWKTKHLIHSCNLTRDQINSVSALLMREKINFMLHRKVPDNHQFYYFHHDEMMEDFQRRLNLYLDHGNRMHVVHPDLNLASQFLAIFDDLEKFEAIRRQLENVKVIRTTSPLDHQSIWMEIFHPRVSKKSGCRWVCDHLGIEQRNTISFGNDYNDLDMLEWTAQSYVVANSPPPLRDKFHTTTSNNKNGFSKILQDLV